MAQKPRRQIFQLLFKIVTSLLIYTENVQAGIFNFPSFSDCCPICHSKNCAVRIGYYYRWVIYIDAKTQKIIVLQLPVARYLCKQKGKQYINHCTFSLLPETLIPYNRCSIDFLMFIIQLLSGDGYSTAETLDKLDELSPNACLVSDKMIYHFLDLIKQTRLKLILFLEENKDQYRAPPDFSSFTLEETVQFITTYPYAHTEQFICSAHYLSVQYYEKHGSYQKNSRFLFGTPSQFCI